MRIGGINYTLGIRAPEKERIMKQQYAAFKDEVLVMGTMTMNPSSSWKHLRSSKEAAAAFGSHAKAQTATMKQYQSLGFAVRRVGWVA